MDRPQVINFKMKPPPSSSGPVAGSHFHLEGKHATPVASRVSAWCKAAYGCGGLTDFFFLNVVLGLAIPIYTVGLKWILRCWASRLPFRELSAPLPIRLWNPFG